MGEGIESFLSTRSDAKPVYAVMDIMMSWSREVFAKFNIPAVSFMTSGACSAAMRYASWKAHAEDMKPGEIRDLPGLPQDMALTYADLRGERSHKRPRDIGRPGGPHESDETGEPPNGKILGPYGQGPPGPGEKPRWLDEVEGTIGLFINTCDDLDHPFINYITNQIGKPVWGVGPLLPKQYWKSAGSLVHDHKIRSNRNSNYTEDEVIQWLDTKPSGSVVYISFGSEVGPTMEEYAELASALQDSSQPFIWVIQPGSGKPGPPRSLFEAQPGPDGAKEEGYFPHGLDSKVGDRGLIIRGWAPQLLILSHTSTGGFLSHCGWNSVMEAIGRGVPLLAWPIRGDQFYNAKLVVSHLKVGHIVPTFDGPSEMVKKDDILVGIDRLMADREVHKHAVTLCKKFKSGFPTSSIAALDAFVDFTGKKPT